MNPRFPLFVIVFLAGVSFFGGFLLFGTNLSFPASLPFFKAVAVNKTEESGFSEPVPGKTLNVAITETNGWHEEVVAAIVHAFGSQPNVRLTLHQAKSRFGMSDIIGNYPTVPTSEPVASFKDNGTTPDIVVLTTCELDSANLQPRLSDLLAGGRTFLFCVVHHGDQWNDAKRKDIIAPWMREGLMDFVTLSPHTAKFLKKNGLMDWMEGEPSIKTLTPLFPLPPTVPNRKVVIDKDRELAFAIQGNYEPFRRDFNTIFSHLQTFVDETSSKQDGDSGANVTLHLLGSGDSKPSVPETLTHHVFFDENLSYSEFYAVLSNTFAILPAFANGEYLDRKASSTVPASLLGGTPLVATKEIISTYSYLPEDAVYRQKEDETELSAIGRILKFTAKERSEKKANVRRACAEIIENNVKLVGVWVSEAVTKIGQRDVMFNLP